MPPFGLFRSEFQIVAGGFAEGRNFAAVVLVCLATLAFLGLAVATTRALFRPGPQGVGTSRGEPSSWMVVPVVAGVVVLLVLGLAPPAELVDLLTRGSAELAAGAS